MLIYWQEEKGTMSRKPLKDDAFYGNAEQVAALEPRIARSTLIRLQAEGRLPVARLQGVWFTNLGAFRKAKERARERGEEWARRELIEEQV
jgi:hypothetical protein